jgi:hypothetical protein
MQAGACAQPSHGSHTQEWASITHRLQLFHLALPCLQLVAAGSLELRQLLLLGGQLLRCIAGSLLLLLQLHLQVSNGVLQGIMCKHPQLCEGCVKATGR